MNNLLASKHRIFLLAFLLILLTAIIFPLASQAQTASATVNVNMAVPTTTISQKLVGVFFEDISFGADGGLYAELVQNRSFEYSASDRSGWTSLTGWTIVQRGGGAGTIAVESASPLNTNNPKYLRLNITTPGTGVGVSNSGYSGINVEAGKIYDFSFWARRSTSLTETFTVQIESTGGTVYATATVGPVTSSWAKYTASLTSNTSDSNARLVVLTKGTGDVYMDMISLFPRETFLNRSNGLRKDLAQKLVDMKTKFVRFPGGCVVHGYTLQTAYHWKNSIGPVEQRKEQPNFWDYHMTYGMGFHEIFQLCEDLGAEPLPILSAGVSCQFKQPSGYQVATVLSPSDPNYMTDLDLNYWKQNALDLIEWANGPTSTTWGAKRAAAGHPSPFNLKYIGIGNEEWGTDFKNNFTYIYNAIRAAYPNIKVIGTRGPYEGDIDNLQTFNTGLGVDMIDEHYYVSPDWMLQHNNRYDSYSRTGPRVFVGEYACQGNALMNAVCEASYLTGLERNADIIDFGCYAPLFCNSANQNWSPNLIWFNTSQSFGSPNYYVQSMYGNNLGDRNVQNSYSYTPVSGPISGKIGLGTWNTKANFRNLKVWVGSNNVFPETFANTSNWTVGAGTWAVSSNMYVQSSTATPAYSDAYNVSGQTSYTYEVEAQKTSGAEGFLIQFGFVDSNNYYWWNIGGWGNATHAVEKCSGGSKSTLGSTASGSITTGTWYAIKIQIDGRRIRCYLNGTLIHDVTDSSTTGSFGISSSTDNETGDLILKLVNPTNYVTNTQVNVTGATYIAPTAQAQVLTSASSSDTNSFSTPTKVYPTTSTVNVGTSFSYSLPAWSLNILRLKTINDTGNHTLVGQYFNNMDFTDLKLIREDAGINFDWGTGTPHALISADTYSVRWTGKIVPRYSETYTFYTTSSDGVRLLINGQWVIGNWTTHTQTVNSGTITLQAGQQYDIKLEYFKNTGSAIVKLEWQSASQAREIVPASCLLTSDPSQITSLGQIKPLADGSIVSLSKPVTIAPSGTSGRVTSPYFFYVEDADRKNALRVQHGGLTTDTLSPGNVASFSGVISTNSLGERYIMPITNPTSSSNATVNPFALNNRAAQLDVNALARLVRTWGRVRSKASDNSYFTISDGYRRNGAESATRVLVYGNSPISQINVGDFITVTGVVSVDLTGKVIICRDITMPDPTVPSNPPYTWTCGFEPAEGYALGSLGGQSVWTVNNFNAFATSPAPLAVVSSSTDPVASGSNALKMQLSSSKSGAWWTCIIGAVGTLPAVDTARQMKYAIWKFKIRQPGGNTTYNGTTLPALAYSQISCQTSDGYRCMDFGQDPDNTPQDLNFHGMLNNASPRTTSDTGVPMIGGRYVEVIIFDDYVNQARSMWYDGQLALSRSAISGADRFGNQVIYWYGTAYPWAAATGLAGPIYIDDVYVGWDYL